ncbi:MAG: porin family protein [Maricaulaceae bacterium]|jgi:hypothetical protein
MKIAYVVSCAALGAAALSVPALAQDAGTLDISGGWQRSSFDVGGASADVDSVFARGTYHLTPHFAGEAEAHFGIGDDDVGGATVELDNAFGIFARGGIGIADSVAVFGRVGYVNAEVSASAGPFAASDTDSGWAAGVGGELFLAGPNGVRADYTRYEFDDGDADAFSISYVRRFGGY